MRSTLLAAAAALAIGTSAQAAVTYRISTSTFSASFTTDTFLTQNYNVQASPSGPNGASFTFCLTGDGSCFGRFGDYYFVIINDGRAQFRSDYYGNNFGSVGSFSGTGNGITSLASSLTISQVGGTTPSVPEPASWAMMVTGFGIAGAAMRRRRTAVSFA